MNRIMLNWFLLMVGLVLNTNGFHNPVHRSQHHHRHPQRDINVLFGAHVDDVVYQTPEEQSPEFRPATECNVAGVWYNSLGSELIINVTETGHVTGEFRTAVERGLGAAGSGPGLVSGWASADRSHNAVGFSVLWSNGASVTAWTGLCHVCNGLEIMKTTWILTSEVDTCQDHWSSNRIGQDDFTRFEQAPGPRHALNIHTPSDFAAAEEAFEEGILTQAQQGL